MTSAGPTILAIEGDSAWIVILAVSSITLLSVLLARRLIAGHGGLASALLFMLPLVLPLVAAFSFDHAVLPVVAVLRPADPALFREASDALHLLFVSDEASRVITAYAISGVAGAWMLWIGLSVTSFMLVRRLIGTVLVHRLIRASRPLQMGAEGDVAMTVERLTESSRLPRPPDILVMPEGTAGAFAVAGKGGRILVSPQLLAELDREELQGILAHEIAHLEARDVPVTFAAGLLRDLVAWNPVAHVAYRRLLADREVEADRRAAALTGDPLSVASGLVRLCELTRRRHFHRMGAALAFGGGRVTHRVANLLALADGRAHLRTVGMAPYVAAALIVGVLGLHAGARIAEQDPGAFAIVWGTASEPTTGFWAPGEAKAARRAQKAEAKRAAAVPDERRTHPKEPVDHSPAHGMVAFKKRFLPAWIKAMKREARRAALSHEIHQWRLQQLRVPGPLSVYRMDPSAV